MGGRPSSYNISRAPSTTAPRWTSGGTDATQINPKGVCELKNTLLHPLHKKGDTRECKNSRGIDSLNAEAKLFEQALLHILNNFIGEIAKQPEKTKYRSRNATSTSKRRMTASTVPLYGKFYSASASPEPY